MQEESRVTVKYQVTIPKRIREYLKVKPRDKVEWHVIRGFVVIDVPRRVKNPVKFLTSQIRLNMDAVKLVKQVRGEFE